MQRLWLRRKMGISCMPGFVFVSLVISGVTSKYCYWNTGCPYKYLSSETPYDLVRGDIRDTVRKFKDCEPASIWSLIRHGEKNPDKEHGVRMRDAYSLRDAILSAYQSGNSGLCAQDVQNLRDWKWEGSVVTAAHELRPEGRKGTLNFAKRLKEIFPDILTSLDRASYALYPTEGEWNVKSAEAFAEGLTESPSKLSVEPLGISHYASCGNYSKDALHKPSEVYKYQNSAEFSTVSDSISSRTGIEYPLNADNVTALYDLCRRFWSNSHNEPSPWCAIFNTEDLRVLEYVGDLTTYYKDGNGDRRNEILGRNFLGHLYRSFDDAKNGRGRRLVAHFGDGPLVGMTVTALGLYRDGVSLPGERRVVDRKWRSSAIVPLGANFLAVMHRCKRDKEQDYKIVFYLNEERLNLCSDGWCTWDEFQNKFESFASTKLEFCD